MTSALVLALVAAGFVADADTPPWIRSSTIDGERTSLQIASRRYVGPEDSMLPELSASAQTCRITPFWGSATKS